MCLWLFTNCTCKDCPSPWACLRACSPLSLLASFLTCPAALFITLFAGLGTAFRKWVPGSAYHEQRMWREYCNVIKQGKAAWEGRSKKTECEQCCDACAGEAYCCAMPLMLIWSLIYPMVLLFHLMWTACEHAGYAFCAGAISPRNTLSWWARVRKQIQQHDRETSLISYDSASKGLICSCCGPLIAPAPQEVAAPAGLATAPQPMAMAHPVAQPVVPLATAQPVAPMGMPVAPAAMAVPVGPPVATGVAVPAKQPAQAARPPPTTSNSVTAAAAGVAAMAAGAVLLGAAASAADRAAVRQVDRVIDAAGRQVEREAHNAVDRLIGGVVGRPNARG